MSNVNRNLIYLSVIAITLWSCTGKSPSCNIESLQIETDLFPSGTHVQPIVAPIPELPDESFAQGFSYLQNAISYSVINWYSVSVAGDEFESILKEAFVEDSFHGPWDIPEELTYHSSKADNYHAACGLVDEYYQCRMGATYNQYSVYLRSDISEEGITFSTFNQLLQAIDEKMSQCTN